jgi:hypothetical protein
MSPHRKISLKVISAVVSAPPVLKASDHTIDYACGNCGAVLLHAEDGQIHNLVLSTAPNAARTIRQTLKAASWRPRAGLSLGRFAGLQFPRESLGVLPGRLRHFRRPPRVVSIDWREKAKAGHPVSPI